MIHHSNQFAKHHKKLRPALRRGFQTAPDDSNLTWIHRFAVSDAKMPTQKSIAVAVFPILALTLGAWIFWPHKQQTPTGRFKEISAMPLNATDYLAMLCRYEFVVNTTWREARKPILEGKTEFEVKSPEGAVRFHKTDPADSNSDKRQRYVVGNFFGPQEDASDILYGMFLFDIKDGNFEHLEFYPGTKALAPSHIKLDFGDFPGS